MQANFRAKQIAGMPIARTTKNKNELKIRQRLPIPDSEIAVFIFPSFFVNF